MSRHNVTGGSEPMERGDLGDNSTEAVEHEPGHGGGGGGQQQQQQKAQQQLN